MKIGIMGAMPEEVSGIIEGLDDKRSTQIGGRDYWEGRWHGLDVVVVFSRWGKVASAATAAILVTRFAVDEILFVGVAGAVDPSLNLADVVVGRELIQHDMDASAIPVFERFEIPLLGQTRFAADPALLHAATTAAQSFVDEAFEAAIPAEARASFGIDRPRVAQGLIASGDRFVSSHREVDDLRSALPDLLCVEMEGGAVAQVCYETSTPLTVVRIISDRADHNAPVDFPRFTREIASIMTRGVAEHLLRLIAKPLVS